MKKQQILVLSSRNHTFFFFFFVSFHLSLLLYAAAAASASSSCKAWLVQSIPTDMPELPLVKGVLSSGKSFNQLISLFISFVFFPQNQNIIVDRGGRSVFYFSTPLCCRDLTPTRAPPYFKDKNAWQVDCRPLKKLQWGFNLEKSWVEKGVEWNSTVGPTHWNPNFSN